MNGYYVIRQGDEILSISKNIITNEGKKLIAQNLCTQSNVWAGEIAIGAGTDTPLSTDTQLAFEYNRNVISSMSSSPVDPTSYAIGNTGGSIRLIAKAVLDSNISGVIYETGLFSQAFSSTSYMTPFFYASISEGWSYSSATSNWNDLSSLNDSFSTTGRAGGSQINLSSITPVSNKRVLRYQFNGNLSYVKPNDTFKVAVVTSTTAGTGATGPTIKFYTDESSYYQYQYSITKPITADYNILSATKDNWTSGGSGNPSWDSIQYIDIEFNTSSPIQCSYLDSFRADQTAVDLSNVLISRSKLVTPVTKIQGAPLEIEYYLDVF